MSSAATYETVDNYRWLNITNFWIQIQIIVVQLKENYNTHHVRLHQLKMLSISTCTLTRLPNFITVTFSPNFYTQKKTTQTKYTDDESHFLMEWEQEVHGPSRPA